MAGYSDVALMDDFAQGKPRAFQEIYHRFFNRLYYFALEYKVLEPEAEEIVLDILAALFKKHKDFENLGNIKAFLYIGTKTGCFDILRLKKRREFQIVEFIDLPAIHSTELIEIETELLNRVYNAVNMLPDRCKTIMELLYKEYLDAEEVSNRLNISVQTVYSQKNRAINLLKKVLTKEGEYCVRSLFFWAYALLLFHYHT